MEKNLLKKVINPKRLISSALKDKKIENIAFTKYPQSVHAIPFLSCKII